MHGVENQDSHAKMGVNGQCVQPLFACYVYAIVGVCHAFVGVLSMVYICIHGLAVVEALWRPTGIYWN